MTTLRELKAWARAEGRRRISGTAETDYSLEMVDRQVDLLLQKAVDLSSTEFMLRSDQPATPEQMAAATGLISRFIDQEPLAYLLESQEFCGEEFLVNRAVLIPRRETEILVEKAVAYCNQLDQSVVLIDVGTGSGAILLSVCRRLKNYRVAVGIEISESALSVAEANAVRLGLRSGIDLLQGDLLQALNLPAIRNERSLQHPLIVLANLPYIDPIDRVPESVFNFEPHQALYAESGGLEKIQRLISQVASQMCDADRLFLEIGAGQFARVKSALLSAGLGRVTAHLDHQGIERIVEAGPN